MSDDKETASPNSANGSAPAACTVRECGQYADLVEPCGTGTGEDVQLVMDALMQLPECILKKLKDQRTKIKVGRGGITDCLTHLKGKRPRSWPEGYTYDQITGMYEATNVVYIATISGFLGGRRVPRQGEGHNSYDLTLHETFHAVDRRGKYSLSEAFKRAVKLDQKSLSDYEDTRRREAFAETAARFFARDPTLKSERLNLYKYFEDNFENCRLFRR